MLQVVIGVLRSGFRSRSFQAILFLGFFLVFVAYLASQFSPRQPKTVALDVGLSGLRISLVLLVLSWVQEHYGKELLWRSVQVSLSYPVSRSRFVLGRYFGILVLLAIATACLAMLLWLMTLAAGGGYEQEFSVALGLPYWAAVFAVWLDAAVVLAFAFCIASVSTVQIMPLAVGAAFAIAAKAVGPVVDYVAQGADGQQDLAAQYGPVLGVIRWVIPDLSRLDWRAWPMYGTDVPWGQIGGGSMMAFGYIVLMLSLSAWLFSRREFA
jgi:ABC-type transport system involved in multi-copper enzyme maturation permease subunit